MASIVIDYSKISLQENIPFSQAELAQFEKRIADNKKLPQYVGLLVFPVIALLLWVIKHDLPKFEMHHYLLLGIISVLSYFFVFGISKLVAMYDSKCLKKDIQKGKSKLQSFVLHKQKNKYGSFMSFAGKTEKEKIRVRVSREDYHRFQKGMKIEVIFLKYRKEAISIVEIDLH